MIQIDVIKKALTSKRIEMIDKFLLQTNETIWDFLHTIGNCKDVFSFYSFLEVEEFTLFFYSTHSEIVLVALDIVEDGTVEYADSGFSLDNESIKYFRKVTPDGDVSQNYHGERISPIALLYEHAKEMRLFYATSGKFKDTPAIHLMLLTNSHITNYHEAIESWQQKLFSISVLHDLSGLKPGIIYDSRVEGRPFIPVNEDFSIQGSEYWSKWHKHEKDIGRFDWLKE